MRSSPPAWSTELMPPSPTSTAMDRTTPMRSSPRTGRRRRSFCAKSIWQSLGQRVHAVCRRRRIRIWRRDRHRHRPTACARPGRRRAAYEFQVPHSRQRPNPAVVGVRPIRFDQNRRAMWEGAFPTGMRSDFSGARSAGGSSAGCAAAACARHADRLVWRDVRSAPCSPSSGMSLGATSPGARQRVVARYTGQSAQGYARPRAVKRTCRGRTGAGSPSAHQRHRFRSKIRHSLHLRNGVLPVCCCRGVHFVWIMGADNLRSFHRWQRWRDIAALVPIAIVDRLGPSLYAAATAAGQTLAHARLPETAARALPERKPPAWIYLHGLKSPLSSTPLRAARGIPGRRNVKFSLKHSG